MSIDIFSVQPHKVSRDLRGRSFLIYGPRKIGKTTCASKFPKSLIIGFEKGWNELEGVKAIPVNSWKDALTIKKQLIKDAEAVERGEKEETYYESICVDTGDIAYDLCERYILDREGVEYLDETEKLRGYRAVSREFDKYFQEIMKAGYTLVIISHADTKQVKENGEKFDRTIPTIPARGFGVIARMVDVIGYAAFDKLDPDEKDAPDTRILILRGNKQLEAGCRNRFMPERIPFTYNALKEAYISAVDELHDADEGAVVEEQSNLYKDDEPEIDFNATVKEIKKIASALNKLDKMDDYAKIVAEYLGKGHLIKDCDESQAQQVALILDDLKDYVKENGIEI